MRDRKRVHEPSPYGPGSDGTCSQVVLPALYSLCLLCTRVLLAHHINGTFLWIYVIQSTSQTRLIYAVCTNMCLYSS